MFRSDVGSTVDPEIDTSQRTTSASITGRRASGLFRGLSHPEGGSLADSAVFQETGSCSERSRARRSVHVVSDGQPHTDTLSWKKVELGPEGLGSFASGPEAGSRPLLGATSMSRIR